MTAGISPAVSIFGSGSVQFDNIGVTLQDGRRITFEELAEISRGIVEQSNGQQLFCFESENIRNRLHVESTFSNAAFILGMMGGVGVVLEDPEAVPVANPTNRLCSHMRAQQTGDQTFRHVRR